MKRILSLIVICSLSGCIFAPGTRPSENNDPADTGPTDTRGADGDGAVDADSPDAPPTDSDTPDLPTTCTTMMDGLPCEGDGDPCTLERCQDQRCAPVGPLCGDCQRCVDGTCMPDLDQNQQPCDGPNGECFDSRCRGGECQIVPAQNFCVIDDGNGPDCKQQGQRDPDAPCFACRTGLAVDAWSPVPSGVSCDDDVDDCIRRTCDGAGACAGTAVDDGEICVVNGDGGVCENASCVPIADDCRIGGALFDPGDPNPTNPCQVCNPAQDPDAWTLRGEGFICGRDDMCARDECNANGTCEAMVAPNGTSCDANPSDCMKSACENGVCNSENIENGEMCSVNCADGTCNDGGCLVTSTDSARCAFMNACYPHGSEQPGDKCTVCENGSWEARPIGANCGQIGGQSYVCTVDGCCSLLNPADCLN